MTAPAAPLLTALELREGQGGFVGTSGLVWRVEPDGSYAVARFLNANEQPPHRRGRLPPARLAALGAVLHHARLHELPAALGTPGRLNPHTTELRYGTRHIVKTGPPGEPEAGAAAPSPAQARFEQLVSAIKAELDTPPA